MMDRCRECDSSLKTGETACFNCGSVVRAKEPGIGVAGRFVMVSKIALIVSSIMTVASLVFNATPPFSKCLVATIVCLFVKSSAEQMLERKKS